MLLLAASSRQETGSFTRYSDGADRGAIFDFGQSPIYRVSNVPSSLLTSYDPLWPFSRSTLALNLAVPLYLYFQRNTTHLKCAEMATGRRLGHNSENQAVGKTLLSWLFLLSADKQIIWRGYLAVRANAGSKLSPPTQPGASGERIIRGDGEEMSYGASSAVVTIGNWSIKEMVRQPSLV